MTKLLCCFFTLALAPCLANASASTDLQQLFDDAWQQGLEYSPIFASGLGHSQYADKMPDVSRSALKTQHQNQRALLQRLNAIDPSQLNDSERISYQLFDYNLQQALASYALEDAVYAQGTQSGFLHTLLYLPRSGGQMSTLEDYQHYLKRLAAIPRYLHQNQALLQEGIDTQRMQARISMEPIIALAQQFNTDSIDQNPLYQPFKNLPTSLSKTQRALLLTEAKQQLKQLVQPAINKLVTFLQGPYSQATSKQIGLLHQNDGERYYAHLIKRHTTTNKSATEIHAIGLREVERIRKEMQAIMTEVGFKGSLEDFIQDLRQNPDFYVTSEQALLDRAAWIAKTIDGKLPALFGHLPRKPYTVAPVPAALAPDYTAGRYLGGNNDKEAGTYWLNTWDLPSRPLYGLPALTAHEAVPGHHLQIALAQELGDLPKFRQYAGFTVFVEGWALYAEYLGIAMGIYTTPYEHFGRLSFEMWRACRLVVDTGIHSTGWSRQQAIDFMRNNTALSLKDIEVEVDRYISWPGQALGYKMGEIKIRALRQQAEKTLGERFNIRAFHDVVLGAGPLPLSLLEQRVNTWIDRTASSE